MFQELAQGIYRLRAMIFNALRVCLGFVFAWKAVMAADQ
jgi:hypothetical protein